MFVLINIDEMYLGPERLPNNTNIMHEQYDLSIFTDEVYNYYRRIIRTDPKLSE